MCFVANPRYVFCRGGRQVLPLFFEWEIVVAIVIGVIHFISNDRS